MNAPQNPTCKKALCKCVKHCFVCTHDCPR